MRAPTPSFTLSPAYGKGTSRPRHQNGSPEIKLYHLSRSTGEAPVKLFVRLVGENGERAMVRVGGGWADLGEYLREYASHHGCRSAVDPGKVEVQDFTVRVATSSARSPSAATMRGNDRSSPVSRPDSAFARRTSSPTLHIRRTRRSAGERDTEPPSTALRTPNTPSSPRQLPTAMPNANYRRPTRTTKPHPRRKAARARGSHGRKRRVVGCWASRAPKPRRSLSATGIRSGSRA